MKIAIAAMLVAGVLGAAAHTAQARVDPLVNGVAVAAPVRASAAEALRRAASEIAGHEVTLRCETFEEMGGLSYTLGYVFIDGSFVIHLSPYACGAIATDDPANLIFGAGLLVVLHEAEHLAGLMDESAANCTAMAVLPGVARRYFPALDARQVKAAADQLFGLTPDSYRHC
jgi:hypothetical protein